VVLSNIKDIFEDLSSPALLQRCLGGRTQNPNESVNSTIWNYCSKTSYSGSRVVQIAAYEATVIFNDGHRGRLDVMRCLDIIPGKYAKAAAIKADEIRISAAQKRAAAATLEARRSVSNLRIKANTSSRNSDAQDYSSGAF
jgi:hypothetical protein